MMSSGAGALQWECLNAGHATSRCWSDLFCFMNQTRHDRYSRRWSLSFEEQVLDAAFA